ncbi:MAG: type IV-A pilus assembly ATPase PilB [Gammaproteobacteria bacterium]
MQLSGNPSITTPMNTQELLQYFITTGILDAETAQQAYNAARHHNLALGRYLAQQQLVPPKQIATLIAQHFQLPFLDLNHHTPTSNAISLLDEKFIRKHHVLPLNKTQQQLQIATTDPISHELLNEIQFHTGLTVQPIIVEYDKLNRAIETYLGRHQYAALQEFNLPNNDSQQEDIPIIRFVEQVLLDAISKGASDIHFEPYAANYQIRIRRDGILHELTQPPTIMANRIAARLKVMAKLDISEKRLPQDGRFSFSVNPTQAKECRMSTCPTLWGEKIVVRLLDSNKMALNADELGFEPFQKQIFLANIKRPQGMILVTGPTGSGKTVTLYTALNLLNTPERNISTVEDPVEIQLSGINQVHVHPKIGLTFSTALRAFLRQDPDIIMVGEIRDHETAEIAIKAAQTGHLVLSTLHTNNAPETLTRLMNMGITPFSLAGSITLIIAQRLLRKLCNHCKHPIEISRPILLDAGFQEQELETLIVYTAPGCVHCMKGYYGRTAVYELLPISEEMVQAMLAQANTHTITQLAKQQGMQLLCTSALHKIKAGITSIEEMHRVL